MLAGVDVSMNQGSIHWPSVSLPGHELAFAFAKATEGTTFTDRMFTANWHGMRERGLFRGAYHFAHPPGVRGNTSARGLVAGAVAEAEHFLHVVDAAGMAHDDLPLTLDLEVENTFLTGGQLHEWVGTWVDRVKRHSGKTPIIYTGGFWKGKITGRQTVWGCPLWLADYNRVPTLPAQWRHWTFWQHTSSGRVNGIRGNVDLNYFHGSRIDLERLAYGPRHRHGHAPPFHRTLRHGMTGSDVRAWQEALRRRGFSRVHATGRFDAATAEGCRWLQLYLGVPVNEEVDENIWRAAFLDP